MHLWKRQRDHVSGDSWLWDPVNVTDPRISNVSNMKSHMGSQTWQFCVPMAGIISRQSYHEQDSVFTWSLERDCVQHLHTILCARELQINYSPLWSRDELPNFLDLHIRHSFNHRLWPVHNLPCILMKVNPACLSERSVCNQLIVSISHHDLSANW